MLKACCMCYSMTERVCHRQLHSAECQLAPICDICAPMQLDPTHYTCTSLCSNLKQSARVHKQGHTRYAQQQCRPHAALYTVSAVTSSRYSCKPARGVYSDILPCQRLCLLQVAFCGVACPKLCKASLSPGCQCLTAVTCADVFWHVSQVKQNVFRFIAGAAFGTPYMRLRSAAEQFRALGLGCA